MSSPLTTDGGDDAGGAFAAARPPDDALHRYARRGLWALPVWAALLLLATLTHQPDAQSDFPGYARYVTTTPFQLSHVVASILGAGVGALGLTALAVLLAGRTPRLALGALVTFALGNALVTAVFGVAAFAQPAIGRAFLAGQEAAAEAINADAYGPALVATALSGLLLFTTGLVLFGVAVARASAPPRLAGIGFALGGVLFAVVGFVLANAVQTVGAALLLASALCIAAAGLGTRGPCGGGGAVASPGV
jgi:hypothetical protein